MSHLLFNSQRRSDNKVVCLLTSQNAHRHFQAKKMHTMKPLYALYFFLFITFSFFAQTPLEQGFDDPPISARPKALWPWLNGNVNLSQVTLELEEAKEKGMGGFDIWDVGMLVDPNKVVIDAPPFMDDQSVQAIGHAVREAERLGLELGLVISSSWNAGGHWIPAKYGAMGLFRSSVEIKGGAIFDDKIPFPELPEMDDKGRHKTILDLDPQTGLPNYFKEVAVIAIPIREDSTIVARKIVNISHLLQADGSLKWKAPIGKKRWKITRYVCTPTGQALSIPSKNSMGKMLDHFSEEAMEFHLDYIITRLQKELGSLENRALKYLYTDSYEVNSAVWTPQLPEAFATRNGYALETLLPILDGYTIENEDHSEQFLYDFKKTLSNLIIENHYQFGKAYCAKYGLDFYAEAGGPGPPIHNVPFEDLKALGALSVPRGEFWKGHPLLDQLQIVKGIASAAHLYNQPSVEAEAFTSILLWQEGPGDLKPLADRAMVEGLNRFVYHTFPHTPPEAGSPGWVYNFGTLIHINNSWWEKSAAFHEYLARCSFLLQQGNFVGDVLFYYGDHAPNFVNDLQKVKELPKGYDYDVVNSDILLNRIVFEDGRFVLPHGQSYKLLVLPNEDRVHPKVLEKLITWQQAGAKIIGQKPNKSYSLSNHAAISKQIEKSAQKELNIEAINVETALRQLQIQLDFSYTSSKDSSWISYIHRQTENAEIYFITNRKNRWENIASSFRVSNKSPEIWNAISGERLTSINYEIIEDHTKLSLGLPPFGSLFVVFQRDAGNEAVSSIPTYPLQKEIPITGDWEIRFPHGWGAPAQYFINDLASWTTLPDSNIQHFSGTATYYKTFELEDSHLNNSSKIELDLGKVKEIAEVYLNGHPLGTTWCAPHHFDISDHLREGKNYLIVEVANVLNNRMIGDAKLPFPYRRTKSNITKGPNAWMTPWSEVELIESGLIGEVRLLVY